MKLSNPEDFIVITDDDGDRHVYLKDIDLSKQPESVKAFYKWYQTFVYTIDEEE